MVSLAELKKKASTVGGARGEQAAAYYTKTKGPSTKYTPSAIEHGPGISAADLTTNSASLKEYNTVQVHRPPPPPKRGDNSSIATTPPLSSTSSSTPRYGSSSSASSSYGQPTAPPAPARKPAELAPRTTPAPPYQYAANNDLPTRSSLPPPSAAPIKARATSNASTPGIKLFSQYTQQDKEEFFGMLDEVCLLDFFLGNCDFLVLMIIW